MNTIHQLLRLRLRLVAELLYDSSLADGAVYVHCRTLDKQQASLVWLMVL